MRNLIANGMAPTLLQFLHPQWFLLVCGYIILCECLFFLYFWKDLQISVKVAIVGNIGSALIGILIAYYPLFDYIWIPVMNVGFYLVNQSYYNMIDINALLSVYILLGLLLETIIIEYCIAVILNAPQSNLLKKITIPNIVTYTMIIGLVLLIGMFSKTLPTENPPASLFWSTDYPSIPWFLIILSLLEVLIIFILPVILFYYCIKHLRVILRVRRYERGKKSVSSNN